MYVTGGCLCLEREWKLFLERNAFLLPPSELRVNFLQERVPNKIVLRSNFKLSIKAFDFILTLNESYMLAL